jgi:hypothetical protein
VYPPGADAEPWRAVFIEDGQRRHRRGATEAKPAAKLEKVRERLAAVWEPPVWRDSVWPVIGPSRAQGGLDWLGLLSAGSAAYVVPPAGGGKRRQPGRSPRSRGGAEPGA